MATILDPKTGDVWDMVDGVWKKVKEGSMQRTHLLRPRYVNGAPTTCANPDCHATFDGAAFRGKSDKLYCTRFCRDEMSDSYTPEELARKVN